MFVLSSTSEQHLAGVARRIAQCVRRAIATTTVDFAVVDGLRTQAEQAELVREGASKKLDSYHLTGHAVDLCPWVAGKLRWKVPPMLQVTIAMREASIHFREPMVWGGVWDRSLADLDPAHLEDAIEFYRDRYRRAHGPGAHPLFDPWHFQITRADGKL